MDNFINIIAFRKHVAENNKLNTTSSRLLHKFYPLFDIIQETQEY